MSEVRLYLDGELVDVDPKTVIAETKQVNSLFEVQDRQTSYTPNFTLLLTNRTSKVLNRLGDTYNTSLKPYRSLTPQVYRGGTPTITDGKFTIKSVEGQSKVKGNIQDGIVSFFDALAGKSLASLNYAGVSHEFSQANVLSSFGNTWSDGYIYSISNYGLFDASNVDLRYVAPSLYVRWLFDQIFTDSGFTYSYRGDVNPLESEGFKTKIITLNKGFVFSESNTPAEDKLFLRGNDTINEDGRKYTRLAELYDYDGYHSITSSPNNNESLIMVNSNNYYEIQIDGDLTGNAVIVIELDDNSLVTINPQTGFSESINVYLTLNSKIKIYSKGSGGYTYLYDFKILKGSAENQINFNSFLTNIKQKDFFKSVLHQYGLIMQREKGTKNYELIRVEDLFLDREGAQDFSSKLHNDRVPRVRYKYGNYAQVNEMTYSYDDSGANFANGSFYIDNENLAEKTTVLKMPFKAPVLSGTSFNSSLIYETFLFNVERNDDGTIKKVKPKSSTPYIMNVTKRQGSMTYNIGDGTSTYNGTIPISDFNGLNLNILISNHYSSFIRTINRIKVYDFELELTASDVYNFDFLKLIYIKQVQRYFYCNKISNFRENKVTKVELIEVNTSRQTTGEYSDDYSNDYNI